MNIQNQAKTPNPTLHHETSETLGNSNETLGKGDDKFDAFMLSNARIN